MRFLWEQFGITGTILRINDINDIVGITVPSFVEAHFEGLSKI